MDINISGDKELNTNKRLSYRRLTVGIILLLLAVGMLYFFLHAGRLLVQADGLRQADIIVVLMGGGPDRMLEAVDLYKAGYAQKIVLVENNQPGYDLLEERGVYLPRDAHLAKSVGRQLGIPEKDCVILPGDALSTQDEARQVGNYVQKHEDVKTILLVSSRYHTARAARIFTRAVGDLDREITVIACPSRYDTFNEVAWWRSREDAKHVVSEYLKLLAFYTVDR